MIFHNETSKHENNKHIEKFHSQSSSLSISLASNRQDLIFLTLVVFGWIVYVVCEFSAVKDLILDKSWNMKIIKQTLVLGTN